jgi:ElaB/YqjD/DUF883 family membrane-anchored ribosome-binding protein
MTSHHDRNQDGRHDRPVSSRDYEREAEHARRRLADNLDELSDRLTPGQVFDEMMTYSRAGGGTFFRAFSNAMRENPLPSLLIGAGCVMFLSEKMGYARSPFGNGKSSRAMRSADEEYDPYGTPRGMAGAAERATGRMTGAAGRMTGAVSDTAGRMTGAVGDTAGRVGDAAASTARSAAATVQSGVRRTSEVAGQQAANVADTIRQGAAAVGDTVAGAADAVRSTTHDLRDQASNAADQVRRAAGSAVGTAAGTVRDVSSNLSYRIADTAERTRRQASEAVRQSKDTATSLITEQPLLCAAIGVAVGAAIASMLPSTEAEDEWMGEASDVVKDAAGQAGSEALDSAKNVAGKVAERAQSAVKEEGLSPSAVADAARRVGEGMQQGSGHAQGQSGQNATGQSRPITSVGPQEGTSSSRT